MSNSRGDFRVTRFVELALIELREVVEDAAAGRLVDAGRVREMKHRVAGRTEFDPLITRREKAASPKPVVKGLVVGVAGSLRHHHHERGQVGVFIAKAVGEPSPNAGTPRDLRSGLQEGHGGVVVDRLGMQRLDHAEVVGKGRGIRKQLAKPRSPLAMPRELEPRRRDGKTRLARRHAREPLSFADGVGQFLAVHFQHTWLMVKQINL